MSLDRLIRIARRTLAVRSVVALRRPFDAPPLAEPAELAPGAATVAHLRALVAEPGTPGSEGGASTLTERVVVGVDGAPEAALLAVVVRDHEGAAQLLLAAIDEPTRRWRDADREVLREIAAEAAERLGLEESESRHRALVEQAFDVTLVVEPDGTIVYASPSATRLLGHDAERMVGTNVFTYVRDRDQGRARQALELLLVDDSLVERVEVLASHASGEWRGVEVVGRLLPAAAGARVILSVRDSTDRQLAEAALRASEERFRSLIASSPLGVFLTDADGGVTFANERAQEMWGASEPELMGAGWASFLHPDDRDVTVHGWRLAASRGSEFQSEYRVVLGDGRLRWIHEIARPLRAPSGRTTGAVSMVEDVSERRELEAQLRQAQKMEAVGQLAGGIAHDFNNLLTVIKAHAEFLLESLPDDLPAREDAREIGVAASRAASLTRQLLAFSRKQLLRPRALDVNSIVAELAPMLTRLLGEDIEVVVQAAARPALVRADPGQLEQVLLNLAVNARDAMPVGGRLTISTRHLTCTEPMAHEHGVAPSGEYAVLDVEDTGIGMTEQVRQRAFEPFFTTKGPGRGTGLGLATVYGIVRQSGGHVTLDSAPGRGTRLRVHLPATTHTPMESVPAQGAAAGVSGTILLVEDEAPLRVLARRMLEQRGYTVLEARDTRHALALATAHEEIDVLLTDVMMPEMNGRELSELVTELRPRVRTIYMSGYTDDVILHRGALSPRLVLVHKPFSAEELASAVGSAVGGAVVSRG